MTVKQLLSFARVTLSEVLGLSEMAKILADKFSLYPRFQDYQRKFMQGLPRSAQRRIGEEYRVGRFFYRQSDYLSRLEPGIVIPRELASSGPFPRSNPNPTLPYGYSVEIRTRSPRLQLIKPYTIWIRSKDPLNRSEAEARAVIELAARMRNSYKATWEFDSEEGSRDTIRITHFVRYE